MAAPLPDNDDDEQYASSEDSDFAPDAAPGNDSESDSESEGAATDERPAKRRRTAGNADANSDAGYDNSGDEAIIRRGEKKKQKKRKDGEGADDEGGEGGLIKTRRQRAAEQEERRVAVASGPVTIDVDAVWAQMLAGNTTSKPPADQEDTREEQPGDEAAPGQQATDTGASNLVRIKRTYNFAGKVHVEEKLVPRDSAEARLFFETQAGQVATTADGLPLQRAAKKAFRSVFEPRFDQPLPQRSDLNLGVAARMQAGRDAQAKKLNTVEKSRMDWAGFVDKEGIKDELELAGKSKDSYAARQDFLARSEARREEEAWRARMAGRT